MNIANNRILMINFNNTFKSTWNFLEECVLIRRLKINFNLIKNHKFFFFQILLIQKYFILVIAGNTDFPIETPEGSLISLREEHSLKASFPIDFTDEGIEICSNDEHSLNA